VAVHYEPGVAGMEIGGDWYDVMLVGDDHLLVVVGDVSGRGLEAASMMASLRYAIRAFASQGDAPGDILGKLNALDDPNRNGRFATVLCAVVDLSGGTATIANAGHPNPLLLTRTDGTRFIETAVGVPVGVMPGVRYESVPVTIPPGATLLAFTDGLFERRGESVDAGMARLREAAEARDGSLVDLLEGVASDLRRAGPADDAALLGLRWQ
jgi:serine phosphatase RsbU (regulator of sigma subunit)